MEAAAANGLCEALILIVEDEILIALDIKSTLVDAGAEVIGPATTLRSATPIALSEPLSAATLDVQLGRETTDAIAAILSERDIPFLFYTGQALPRDMRARWPQSPVIIKPASQNAIVAAMAELLGRHRAAKSIPGAR
ncbi:MAG: response regulator [Bradyrhizobium sp.]|nr:MAG: response regulator [Bradyrhizobium sp.]